MPSFTIRNENFRDEVVKNPYPFDPSANLEDNEVYIGTSTVLDAVFYMKQHVTLPLFISRLDGTEQELQDIRIEISDSAGTIVGNAVADFDTEILTVYDGAVDVGKLLVDVSGIRRLIGRVAGRFYEFDELFAPFAVDVCTSSERASLRYVKVGDEIAYGDVKIVARHGVSFELNGDQLQINVLGSTQALAGEPRLPLQSVNSVSNPSIWLANAPESNLRIVTEDGKITFHKAREVK